MAKKEIDKMAADFWEESRNQPYVGAKSNFNYIDNDEDTHIVSTKIVFWCAVGALTLCAIAWGLSWTT